jgi:hypothetical protein
MDAEKRIRAVRRAEFRVLCALRLALTAMHDAAIGDIFTIAGHEPDDRDPEQSARTRAWNVTGALLLRAAKSLEMLWRNPSVGECDVATTLKECEGLIELKQKEISDERLRPLREELERVAEEKRRLQEGRGASGSEK